MLSDEKIAEISVDLAARHIVSDIVFARAIEAAVLEAQRKQKPFGYLCDWGDDSYGLQRIAFYYGEPGSATEDDWNESPKVHRNLPLYAAPVVQPDQATKEYIVQLECAVDNLLQNSVQPDMVLVPREPTKEMLAVIRNERGAYGTGEALYADLIAAAEGKK